ncbi:MAG: hypothetical protein U0835_00150 [Isosphaeraceae bacterium]
MPINSYSVGKDLAYTVVTPSGNLTLNGKTDYSIKPLFTELRHKGLNGINTAGVIPDGWQIEMRFDRTDPNVDNYFAQIEADYFNGVNQQGGTIYETITEKDGSVSQYRYTDVILKYDNAGDWKGDTLIPISVTAMASRRIRVA